MGIHFGGGGLDLAGLQAAGAVPRLIRGRKTFTGAANLGATGANELFTTTGACAINGFWVRCSTKLVDAVDGALFELGLTGKTNHFADFTGTDLDTIDTGDWLELSVPSATVGAGQNIGVDQGESARPFGAISANIIMTISTQAITGGALDFYVLYTSLSSDGALALGAGMTAI